VAIVWLAVLALLFVLDRMARSRPPVDALFRSFAVPVLAQFSKYY
jgi:hypothetical protein